MERMHGIEPRSFAWKACALPLSYIRMAVVPAAAPFQPTKAGLDQGPCAACQPGATWSGHPLDRGGRPGFCEDLHPAHDLSPLDRRPPRRPHLVW